LVLINRHGALGLNEPVVSVSCLIVLLMGDAGLRQGELRGLHVSDVRFDPAIIRAASAEHRKVPMTSRLAEALREYIAITKPAPTTH
jgi:integrase